MTNTTTGAKRSGKIRFEHVSKEFSVRADDGGTPTRFVALHDVLETDFSRALCAGGCVRHLADACFSAWTK